VNTDTRKVLAARNLHWLFLAVAALALVFGKSFARDLPYGIVLAVAAVLNAATYVVPLDRLDARGLQLFFVTQLTVEVTVVALACAYSGGASSPLYPFLLVTVLVPAITSDPYTTAGASAYGVLAFLGLGSLLGNPLGAAPSAFIKIALLAVLPLGTNLMLSTYRSRMRDRETFSALYRIGRSLGESLDLKQVLRSLLGEMDRLFQTDISSVRLLDPGTNSLVVKASGAEEEEVNRDQIEIRMGEGFIGWVAKTGEPFLASDITKDPRFATFPRARKKVASAIAAPIKINERTVGVISCASSTRKRFSRDDLDLLVSVAGISAEAIERAELYQQLLSRGEAVMENMADGLIVVDLECRVVMTNHAAREMLGLRPGQGDPLESLLKGKAAEWRQVCREIQNKVIDSTEDVPAPFTIDLKIIAGKGEGLVLRARVSPILSQWSKVIGAVLLLDDVTGIMRLTGELALEKAKLEAVLENAVVGVLAVSREGEVVIANASVFNMLGAPRPWWWLGSDVQDAIGEGSIVRLVRRCIDEEKAIFDESAALSSGRHVEVSCVPIKELSPGKPGVVAVLHDVTGLHRVEQARSDFVSMVSHELRTPLTSIKAYVDTLQRQDVRFDEETRSSFINVISRETERMTRLINDILDLSRIEAGRLDLKPTFVDLPPLINRVVGRIEPQALNHRIVLDMPEDMEPVLAEAAKIEQVLLNLLGNAIKYSPEGGEVSLSVKRLKEKSMVSVTDHGIGIPREQLPHIFDKYHRAAVGGEGGVRGAGLGLFVTKSIVEAHGGRIWAESREGEGTTVIFTIPLASTAGTTAEIRKTGDEIA
jgi:two-component system, OmpR family, phosphate regulon sensor histidine kinase PhoR